MEKHKKREETHFRCMRTIRLIERRLQSFGDKNEKEKGVRVFYNRGSRIMVVFHSFYSLRLSHF